LLLIEVENTSKLVVPLILTSFLCGQQKL